MHIHKKLQVDKTLKNHQFRHGLHRKDDGPVFLTLTVH